MSWSDSLERIADLTGDLVKAAEVYYEEIEGIYESAKDEGHSEKTMHIWEWQVTATKNFMDLVMEQVHPEFIRMAEQDYILRRTDVDEILV